MASRNLLVFVAFGALVVAADTFYFIPRYGGFIGRLTNGLLPGSESESILAELGAVRSALSIYYGDTKGQYPETLDVLWKNGKYLPRPIRRAHVYAGSPGGPITQPHWYRDSAQVKYFSSPLDADDTGGWGFVNDPKSPQYGSVFVNCTHTYFKKNVPWNLVGDASKYVPPSAVSALPEPPNETSPRSKVLSAQPTSVESPLGVPAEVRGRVTWHGAPISGADLVFTSELGGAPIQTKSDITGRYSIELPAGRYHLAASHEKYAPYSTGGGFFVVRAGIPNPGHIQLEPLP